MLAQRVPDLPSPPAARTTRAMARISELIGAVIGSTATPGPQAGIMAVPGARALLMLVVVFLIAGVFLTMRLQFSRYEQVAAIRWSAAACFIAVIVCGIAAIMYGQASL